MKSILISINPKWVAKILNGERQEWATKELTESKGAPLDIDPNQCSYLYKPNDYEFEEEKEKGN